MNRTMWVFVFMAAVLAPSDSPAQERSPEGGAFRFDEVLRRDGHRDHTLGTTGRRLFADRIDEALGVRGLFGYVHAAPDFQNPFTLAFRDEQGALDAHHVRTTWQPSFLEVEWRLAPGSSVKITERKFITDDDVIVDRVRVTNRSPSPISIEAVAKGGLTPLLDRSRSRQIHFDLSSAANLVPSPGRRLFTDPHAPPFAWVEGEDYIYRSRDSGIDPVASASGKACLGGGFGATEGHMALWVAIVPDFSEKDSEEVKASSVCFRYARGLTDSACFRLIVDNDDALSIEFPPTGGWGKEKEHWSTLRVPAEGLTPGLHKIGLRAEKGDATIKVDGFFLLPRAGRVPLLPESARFPTGMDEQILYLPGSIDYDGVRYLLPDPGADMKPTLVALKGATEGDRAFDFPESIEIDAPEKKPGVAWCHLLCLLAGPRGYGEGPCATVDFCFDDGSKESVPFPIVSLRMEPGMASASIMRRSEWRFLVIPRINGPCVQLSYLPPPGRFIDKIVVRKEGSPDRSPEIPVLLAATSEVPPPTGRRPLHLGQKTFADIPVTLALTGSDFVPLRADGGERMLLRSIQLEPGASEEFSLVLATHVKTHDAMTKALDWTADPDPLRRHRETYRRWFDEFVPSFQCSDPYMEKAWFYRWWLARHCMLWPQAPPLSAPVFYESLHGDAAAMVTARSTPHIVSEVRWLRDKRFAVGQVRAHLRTPQGKGLFADVRVDGECAPYLPHSIPAAAIGVYHVHNEEQYLKEVLSLLSRNVDATLKATDGDGDNLPALSRRAAGELKSQPSFAFFDEAGNPPQDVALERPDFAAFVYASCQAVGEGYALLGDRDKERAYRQKAERIKQAVLGVLWNEEDRFFYSVRARDNVPARGREKSGYYPFSMGLCDGRQPYGEAFGFLADPEELHTPFPFLLDALGKLRRNRPARAPGEAFFEDYLQRATRLHFEEGDLDRPMLRAGEGADWFCSSYNDVLVRFVGGLVPGSGRVAQFRPVVDSLDHFRFSRLRYHGCDIEIVWVRPGTPNPYAGRPEGYTIMINGAVAANESSLRRVMVNL